MLTIILLDSLMMKLLISVWNRKFVIWSILVKGVHIVSIINSNDFNHLNYQQQQIQPQLLLQIISVRNVQIFLIILVFSFGSCIFSEYKTLLFFDLFTVFFYLLSQNMLKALYYN